MKLTLLMKAWLPYWEPGWPETSKTDLENTENPSQGSEFPKLKISFLTHCNLKKTANKFHRWIENKAQNQ